MKIAILGCGSIGRRHLHNLAALRQSELVAFDPSPEARSTVQRELPVVCATTLDDVWSQRPDAAVIAAPTDQHVALAREVAERGLHLFVEKPLSFETSGLNELCAAVDARKLVTMVACNMRFHPGPAQVKRLIDSAILGAVLSARIQSGSYLPAWRPQQEYRKSYSASTVSGGAVLDCIHEIDLALWYLGPAAVAGAMGTKAAAIGLETDGLAEILLRHDSGALSSVHLNFIQRDYRRGCEIICERGTIFWNYTDKCVKVFGENGELKESIPEPPGWHVNQMYVDEMREFLDSVRAKKPTSNPIANGIAALGVALDARRKIWQSF